MFYINENVQLKCRTCLDTTENNFHSLNGKLVKDNLRKSMADFLWEISKLDTVSETAKKLPQQICDSCLRKLKVAFSFVIQVQQVNKDMLTALGPNNVTDIIENSDEDTPENAVECEIEIVENKEMEIDSNILCHTKECFIDCNTPFENYHEDPLLISQSNKRKRENRKDESYTEDPDEFTTSVKKDNAEKRSNPRTCDNECHKEMKSMLQQLMTLQKQINIRVEGGLPDSDIDLPNNEKNIQEDELCELKESVRRWFPISSIDEALEVERKIKSHGYAEDVISYVKNIKTLEGYSVDDVLRFVFKHDLIVQLNPEERQDKMSLIKFESILKCIHEVFPDIPSCEFFKLVRKYVTMCDNRNKQKKQKLKKKHKSKEKGSESHDEITIFDEDVTLDHTFETNIKSEEFCNEIINEDTFASDAELNDDEQLRVSKSPIEPAQYTKRSRRSTKAASPHKQKKCIPVTLVDSPENVKSHVVDKFSRSSNRSKNEFELQGTNNVETKLQKHYEISSLFPIATLEKVQEVEENLKDTDYAERVSGHLSIIKKIKGEVGTVLRCIFKDELIENFNFDGLKGRHALNNLRLVSNCLYIFPGINRLEFTKKVRQYIFMSHRRISLKSKSKASKI
ncbi:uncharacterized protein LOC129248611 isoform X2 [Anastrepha obliqua]|uniref:uncharacterized protein LOC129248611 isoform X2 n=1 Tax=Anastrepha obliqua TaxID=95512 RepID=UPI00240A4EAE|nr:uncharacterized protein LOC129248611 isoform X2 [Anastrepha obliqua]